MTEDQLERATRAFRDDTARGRDRADAILERIERSRRGGLRPQWRVGRVGALTLAAALVGTVAWASATGRVTELFNELSGLGSSNTARPGHEPPPPPAQKTAARGTSPAREARGDPPAASAESSASSSFPANREDVVEAPGTRRRRATPAAPIAAGEGIPPEPTDVDALYRAAHQAHFTHHDYVTAVAAWDRYLAHAGPESRMLVEARYNRGIALARLGRIHEATQALEPFSNGEYGLYRRDEARRIIDSLGR